MRKRVLYITNIQVPYRVKFFNELSKKCDLTVLFERSKSSNRNVEWTKSIECNYEQFFLDGIKIGNESSFSFKIIKYLMKNKYDIIILGCYSTPVQILANFFMRFTNKEFVMNFDGEVFANDKSFKSKIKKYVIKGASAYLIAGEESARNLKKIVGDKQIVPYYFSSLSENEINKNIKEPSEQRQEHILVVGQYFDYKGLDVAVNVAKKMPNQLFKFVGMGNRTNLFKDECEIKNLKNIILAPFLQKEELFYEYKTCKCMLLPTRQECWGLVINEAASFGTPIISTYGSGAAVEFLKNKYDTLLARPNSDDEIIKCISNLNEINVEEYSMYLKDKSLKYSIEQGVKSHMRIVGD